MKPRIMVRVANKRNAGASSGDPVTGEEAIHPENHLVKAVRPDYWHFLRNRRHSYS